MQTFSDWFHYRHLFINWFKVDVKRIYFQHRLGVFWLILDPLIMMVVYTLMFAVVARMAREDIPYPVFFMSGMTQWGYLSRAVGSSTNVVSVNSNLLQQVAFPRELIVIRKLTGAAIVELLMTSLLFLGLLVFYQRPIPMNILWAWPFALIILFVLTAGLSFLVATLGAFSRDMISLVPYILRIFFFISGILFPLDRAPQLVVDFLQWNPVAIMIQLFRDILIHGEFTVSGLQVLWLTGFSIAMFVLGFGLFKRYEWYFSDVI